MYSEYICKLIAVIDLEKKTCKPQLFHLICEFSNEKAGQSPGFLNNN
jgi:hypothetical protein